MQQEQTFAPSLGPILLKMSGPIFLIVSAIVASMCSSDARFAKSLSEANTRLKARHRELRKILKQQVLPVAREAIARIESLQKERLASFCVLRQAALLIEQINQANRDEAIPTEAVDASKLKAWKIFGSEAEAVIEKIANGHSLAKALSGGAFSTNAGRGLAPASAVSASRGSDCVERQVEDEDRSKRARFTLPGLLASPVITFASVPVKCRDEGSEEAVTEALANMGNQETRLQRDMEAIRDIGIRADELRQSSAVLREALMHLVREAANSSFPAGLAAAAAELFNHIKIPLTTTR